MKLILFILCFTAAQASARVYGQTIDLSVENVSFEEALITISKQSKYALVYNSEVLKNTRSTSIYLKGASLEKALNELFRDQPLRYTLSKNTIVVQSRPTVNPPVSSAKEVIQQRELSGRVTDEDGQALVGVSVRVGEQTTFTDDNGIYSLQVSEQETIVFTYLGYLLQEIVYANQTRIDVIMIPDMMDMDEVVVVGYSSKRQSELASSVSIVSGEDLRDVTSNDLTSLLQGKAPGVVVSSSSGDPNETPTVIIRGSSSITAGSEPLYVVDGIIGGTANPNDIESISILKDAAATGLYGSRASNGVIIITTKSGRSGKTQVNVSSVIGFNTVDNGKYKVMNSQQLYDYQKSFWDPATWERDRPASLLSQDTDWRGLMFKTGMTHNHTVTVSGGSENTQMYVSGNYYNEEGTLGPTSNEAYNIRSNITHNINEKLKLGVRINAITRKKVDEAAGTNFLTNHENMPWDNPYNPDGSLKLGTEEGWIGRDNDNFLHGWHYNFDQARESSINGDFILDYNITEGLSFSSNNRASYTTEKRALYYDSRSRAGGANAGSLTNDFFNSNQLITSNRLLYETSFDRHNFTTIVVAEAERNYSDLNSTTGVGLAPGLHVMDAASTVVSASSNTGENAFIKGLVQVDYNFDRRYFVVGSFIREASSRFGANNRSANFYTLGGTWILSNEQFMQNHSSFDLLKVRASYGLTGNAQINNYQTLGLYSFSSQYAGFSAAFPSQLVNDNLTWEKAETINLGLDAGVFQRVSLNLDIYQKISKALLLDVELPYTTGFNSVMQNVGSVRNRGLEINLNTLNLDGALKWETNFNIAFNRSLVLNLDQDKDILDIGTGYNPTRIIRVGYDLNSWYMRNGSVWIQRMETLYGKWLRLMEIGPLLMFTVMPRYNL